MHALLAFLPRSEADTARVPRELLEASDWAVLFTLGTLLFLLGAFAMWAWLIWRRSTRPEPHMKLLMELEEEEAAANAARTQPPQEEQEPQAPWEQSPDWWKQADP